MNNKKTSFGFTLIELLMVISIITLISSIFFSYVGSARAKSRDAVRLSDMKQINTAASMYYEDTGTLPISIGTGDGGLVPKYLSVEPKDPKTGISYPYKVIKNGDNAVAFVVHTSYETQFVENTSNTQEVGTVTGNISMTELCLDNTGGDSYPNCSSSYDSNDQIVDITSGHKSNRNESIIIDNRSNCSENQIDLKCPNLIFGTPCFCDGKINNIDIGDFLQEQCQRLINYGLYWYNNLNSNGKNCVDETLCVYNYGGQWNSSQTNKCVLSESSLCNKNGGKWLDLVDGGGVCLEQSNCDNYSASPYNRYWSYELGSCEHALPKSSYTNQVGCINQGGTWTNLILSSSNSNSNLATVFVASITPPSTPPATSTTYRCLINNMFSTQCAASGGSTLGDDWCHSGCRTSPRGICDMGICSVACTFEAE